MCTKPIHVSMYVLLAIAVGAAQADLVSHWALDDGGGETVQDLAGTNHGTIVGNPTWIAGTRGGALEFHGLGAPGGGGDYIDCGNDASLDITGPISITLWIRPGADDPEGKGTETAPMAKAESGMSPSWSWQVRYGWGSSEPHMAFTFNTSPRAWAYVGKNLERDEWCHIACSHDGATLKCYLNGEETDSTPMGAITSSSTPVLIGSDGWGCDWIGAIDDVRIYDHGLTHDEIAEICPPPRTAKNPQPEDGATAVVAPLFRWDAGYKAVLHEVYLGTTPELDANDLVRPGDAATLYWHATGLEAGQTYYWRVDEIEEDLTTVNTGDVWSFTMQALTAYLPTPADGAVDVSPSPTLTWLPGQAVAKHQLYFGQDADAVAQGAGGTDQGELTEATFEPGDLDPLATYYWRVDETAVAGEVRPGPVWSFTTYLPVDDFEDYTDDIDGGMAVFQTWIDGVENGTGSYVGYEQSANGTFNETVIVHGGGQSMPLDYNNVDSPFLSEAQRTFAPVEDWAGAGVDTLVLHVRGRYDNAPSQIYVVLQDTSNGMGVVAYPDTTPSTLPLWTEWKVPLSAFEAAGVNLSRVKMLVIGVGDKENPTAGGAGGIYIDDIYLTKPAPSQ